MRAAVCLGVSLAAVLCVSNFSVQPRTMINLEDPSPTEICRQQRNGSAPAPHSEMLRVIERLPLDMRSEAWTPLLCPGIRFDLESIFSNVYASSEWTHGDSRVPLSGSGSTLEASAGARKALQHALESTGALSVLDIPCGDLTWMKELFPWFASRNITYIGADIVPGLIAQHSRNYPQWRFVQADYVKDELPVTADLIFNREALQHVNFYEVFLALHHFNLLPTARFLLTTSYDAHENSNLEYVNGATNTLIQLDKSPYGFTPLVSYKDGMEGGVNSLKLFVLPMRRH